MPQRCFIAIGSNLGDPARQIGNAVDRLGELRGSELVRVSSIYLSRPMGPSDQPDFLNAVVQLSTSIEPFDLLQELQRIEKAHGRQRPGYSDRIDPPVSLWTRQWGPRTLDLDLLLYGDRVIDTPELRVPHPGLHQRDFVLLPLQEIDRGLVIPGFGAVAELLACCPSHQTVRYLQSPHAERAAPALNLCEPVEKS